MTGLEVLLPALLPVLGDGVRGLFNKFTGGAGAKPANVQEVVQLMDAETARLKVIAEIDSAEGVSTWVANVRAMQRPVAVALILAAYVLAALTSDNEEMVNGLGAYAQMVTFYLFGDRTYAYFKKGK